MMHQAAVELTERLRELSAKHGREMGIVVPVPKGLKIPANPKQSWTEETSLQSFEKHADVDIGILVSGLLVLDFDDKGLYVEWAAEHREIESAPAERTKAGMHVYFLRTPAANLFSGPLVDNGAALKVGRITVSPSGAPNLVVCAPSTDKEWVADRSLLRVDPSEMSEDLLRKVQSYSTGDYFECS